MMSNKEIVLAAREIAATVSAYTKVKKAIVAGQRDDDVRVKAAREAIVFMLHREIANGVAAENPEDRAAREAAELQARREAAVQRILNGELDDRLA